MQGALGDDACPGRRAEIEADAAARPASGIPEFPEAAGAGAWGLLFEVTSYPGWENLVSEQHIPGLETTVL